MSSARGKQAALRTAKGKAGRQMQGGRGFGGSLVYDTLRGEILSLAIEPGTLLDETALSDRFKLSRSPVREALIRLSAEGLVKALRNRSSVVSSFNFSTLPNYLDAIELMYRATARLAALNRSAEQLEGIRQLQRQHEAAARRSDHVNTIRLNYEFHLAIAEAGGNSFFTDWTRGLLDQGQRILGMYIHAVGDHVDSSVLSDHVAIVQGIEARDPAAAEEAGRRDANIIASQLRERLTSTQTSKMSLSDKR